MKKLLIMFFIISFVCLCSCSKNTTTILEKMNEVVDDPLTPWYELNDYDMNKIIKVYNDLKGPSK